GAHEHILRALLGGTRVAGQAQAQGVHASCKLAVEIPEGCLIPSLRSADELVRHVAKTPPEPAGFGGSKRAEPGFEVLLRLVESRALLRQAGGDFSLQSRDPRPHRRD